MSFQVIKSQFLDVEIMLHISTKDICETSYYLYCHLERTHEKYRHSHSTLKKINLPWIAVYIFYDFISCDITKDRFTNRIDFLAYSCNGFCDKALMGLIINSYSCFCETCSVWLLYTIYELDLLMTHYFLLGAL